MPVTDYEGSSTVPCMCVSCHESPNIYETLIATTAYVRPSMPKNNDKINARFPNVTGVIDCTHVRIQAPSLNEPDYAVWDAQFRIINLVAKWPGSVHDSRVFRVSQLCRQLETGHVNGILLGSYLMTPYLNPQTAMQERFNKALVKTRVLIEQTFGVMKRRFPCLSYGLRCYPLRACETTAACAVLHNFGMMRGDMFCRNTDVVLDAADKLGQ